jgi:hypothetical protein
MFSAGMDDSNIVIEPEEAPSEDSSDAEDEKDPCKNPQHIAAQKGGNIVNPLTQKNNREYGIVGYTGSNGEWGITSAVVASKFRRILISADIAKMLNMVPEGATPKFVVHGHPDAPGSGGFEGISGGDMAWSNGDVPVHSTYPQYTRGGLDVYATGHSGNLYYYQKGTDSRHWKILNNLPAVRMPVSIIIKNCPVKSK